MSHCLTHLSFFKRSKKWFECERISQKGTIPLSMNRLTPMKHRSRRIPLHIIHCSVPEYDNFTIQNSNETITAIRTYMESITTTCSVRTHTINGIKLMSSVRHMSCNPPLLSIRWSHTIYLRRHTVARNTRTPIDTRVCIGCTLDRVLCAPKRRIDGVKYTPSAK